MVGVVLIGLLIVQFVPISRSQYDSVGFAILVGIYCFLIAFCAVNLQIKGMWLALSGIALNALVVTLNKGMPVSSSGGYVVSESIKHQASTANDILPWLSDIITLNFMNIAISIGDILVGIGLVYVFIANSRTTNIVNTEVVSEKPMENETDKPIIAAKSSEALSSRNEDAITPESAAISDDTNESDVFIQAAIDDIDIYLDLTGNVTAEDPMIVDAADAQLVAAQLGIDISKPNDKQDLDNAELVLVAEEVSEKIPIDISLEQDKVIDLVDTGETPVVKEVPMLRSSRGPTGSKSDHKRQERLEKMAKSRAHRRWLKHHGMSALPSKESLGFDLESMEIVEAAK